MAKNAKTSTAVKARWNEKTYKRYQIYLRQEEDAELIAYIEQRKAAGNGTSEIFREALEKFKNNT